MQRTAPTIPKAVPPPGLRLSPQTLIVAGAPRSGSNWLISLITSTGVMGRPREWFSREREGTMAQRMVASATEAVAQGATPNGIVGIKIFPQDLQNALEYLNFSAWFARPTWVLLQRRDLLGQAISLWRAAKSGEWMHKRLQPEYNAEEIEVALMGVAAVYADWEVFFARTGITPLRIVYEEALDDSTATLKAISDALVVDLPPELSHTSHLSIQRDEWTAAIRTRYRAERGDVSDSIRLIRRRFAG